MTPSRWRDETSQTLGGYTGPDPSLRDLTVARRSGRLHWIRWCWVTHQVGHPADGAGAIISFSIVRCQRTGVRDLSSFLTPHDER